jgi:hypothetical protein
VEEYKKKIFLLQKWEILKEIVIKVLNLKEITKCEGSGDHNEEKD